MCSRLVRISLFALTAAAIVTAVPVPFHAGAIEPSVTNSKEWAVTPQEPVTIRVAVPRDLAKSMIELQVTAIEPSDAKPKISLFAGAGVPANGPKSGKYIASFETNQGGTGTYRFVADLTDALSQSQLGGTVDVTVVVLPTTTSARRSDVSVTIANLDIQDATHK